MDVLSLSAAELLERYRAKQLSPVEVTRAALDRIGKLQPTYNAFVLVGEAEAMRDARASEARWLKGNPIGLVDGVPTTVKDLLLLKGWPTRRGSRTVDPNQPWDEDSAAVARMREQGAVFLGKTTTPEFGWKGVTDSPLTGITRNPWNPKMTPGGSSGGSAAALAAGMGTLAGLTVNPWDTTKTPGGSSGGAAVAAAFGMGVLHIATDGGGSIRIPAGFCGLFGFKPTFGLVPVHPHPPPWTLWHQGPISRTVHDAALMLTIISRPDVRDFYAAPPLGIDYRDGLEYGIRGMRVAYSRTLGYAKVDPAVATLIDEAVATLARLGAQVEEIDLALKDPIEVMQPLWAVALAMAVQPLTAEQRSLMDQPLLDIAQPGFSISALEYRALEKQRETLARRMNLLHQQYDLLVTPQLATTAFAVNCEVPPGNGMKRWWEWSPFTYPFNLTQQPCATVPCGFAANKLPVAMQIVGAKFAERKVLRAARAYEQAKPFVMPPLPAGVQ
jgi:aspartyl-tRNA(Asn)/glutamyl-tRNA(Gln) amidotransferase subunit A